MSPRARMDRVRKAQIRAAAAELISERGLTETRVTDIAARAGTSASAVLYWFKGKDALLAEALTFTADEFYARFAPRLQRLSSSRERLQLLVTAILFDYDWRLWLELCVASLRDPSLAQARHVLDRRWRNTVIEVIREGQSAGEFAAGDARRIGLALAGVIDGLGLQMTLGDPEISASLAADIALERATEWLGVELQRVGAQPPAVTSASARRAASTT